MSGFWTWALKAYARPRVAEACLDLQDVHGQNVPLLLWACWAAGEGRALPADVLAEAADIAARWEDAAVSPLRVARRSMKAPQAGIDDAVREALRAEVKALELKAEQALMLRLETRAPLPDQAPLPLLAALAAASAAWRSPAAEAALSPLVGTLS